MKEGTIIHGTLRSEDLIPAFMEALDEALEESTFKKGADSPSRVANYGKMQDYLGDMERRVAKKGYYNSDEPEWDIEWLMDRLNDFAPRGCVFGAHPGDGSDFGFWADDDGESDSDEEADDDDDGDDEEDEDDGMDGPQRRV